VYVSHTPHMRIHGALERWLALELALSRPAIFGLIGLAIARPLRELRLMSTDVFLQAVLYPQVGAIVGAALSLGELWAGKPDGVFIIAIGGLILPMFLGGTIGKRLGTYLREDNPRFAPSCWQPDVERLSMVNQLTRQERRSYLTRAAELTTAGHEKCAEAWARFFESAENEIGVLAYSALFLAEDAGMLGIIADKPRSACTVRAWRSGQRLRSSEGWGSRHLRRDDRGGLQCIRALSSADSGRECRGPATSDQVV